MSSDLPPDSGRALSIAMLIVIVTVLTVVGVGILRWAMGEALVFGPTPTPTATARAQATATADFRATRVSEDIAAAATYSAEIGFVTPAIELTLEAQDIFVPIVVQGEGTEATPLPLDVSPTPAQADVLLPIVSGQERTQAAPESPLASPPPAQDDSPLQSPTPFDEATATPTPVPTNTPTPLPTTGPPPPPFVANEMRAVVRASDELPAAAYQGPSSIYTFTQRLNDGQQLLLSGRTTSGEWVYGRIDGSNDFFWIRQAHAIPTANDFGAALPTEEPSDDARWLATRLPTRLPPTDATPIVTPTPIPAGDYPLLRHDPANQARLPTLPRPPLQPLWNQNVSGQSLVSPLTVAGNNVVVSSNDGHVYFQDRVGGNQRGRVLINNTSRLAAAMADGVAYMLDESGRLVKLRSDSASIIGSANLAPPSQNGGGINLIDRYLLVSTVGTADGNGRLFLVERENMASIASKTVDGANIQYAAVGDQLVYVGGTTLYAFDPFDPSDRLRQIWRYPINSRLVTPPVYVRPGSYALAELYIADEAGRITILDANTGLQKQQFQLGSVVITGLAVDDERLYIAGNNFLRAMRREDAQNAWENPSSVPLSDGVIAGPFVDDNEVLIIQQDGSIRYFDKRNGAPLSAFSNPSRPATAGAVAGTWLFVPGTDARLYGWQGGQ